MEQARSKGKRLASSADRAEDEVGVASGDLFLAYLFLDGQVDERITGVHQQAASEFDLQVFPEYAQGDAAVEYRFQFAVPGEIQDALFDFLGESARHHGDDRGVPVLEDGEHLAH